MKTFEGLNFFLFCSFTSNLFINVKLHSGPKEMYRSLLKFFSKNPALKTIVIPLSTVFTRISAVALIKFPQMRRLFEGGDYLSN